METTKPSGYRCVFPVPNHETVWCDKETKTPQAMGAHLGAKHGYNLRYAIEEGLVEVLRNGTA